MNLSPAWTVSLLVNAGVVVSSVPLRTKIVPLQSKVVSFKYASSKLGSISFVFCWILADSVAAFPLKLTLLKSKGYEIIDLEMPALKYALAAYYIIVPAEVASNLSRYDGIRYGFRSEKSENLDALYKNTRGEGFMPENKRRIMIGNFVLSSGFYDAYFLKAAKARTLIVQEYAKAFEKCDFILSPVTPNPAFKLGEKTSDPVTMYLEDAMTVPLNLAGVPGLTIPAGKTEDGVALGLQLIGPRRSDKNLIEFSKELA